MAQDALVGAGGIPLSADILGRLLEASQDVLYAVALDPVHMLYATPTFAQRMGLAQDFLARGYRFDEYLTAVHPDDQDRVAGIMAAIIASRTDDELPENPASYRLRTPEGGWRIISDTFSVLRGPDGTPHTLIGNSSDISEHKRAQQTLKERDARFRLLAENSRDLFFSMRFPEGRYEFLSPSVEKLLGFTPQDFYNDPSILLRSIAPDWRARVQGWLAKIAQGTVADSYEFQVLDKHGRLRWFNQRQVLVPTPDGQGMLLQGVATDVTDLRAAQQALADNEARFRSLAENSRDTFFSFRVPEGRYEFVSANVAGLLGHSAQEFYDDPGLFMRCVAPQWRERMAAWNAEIAQGRVRDKYEFEVLDGQGRLRWILERLMLVPAPVGQGMLLQGVVADITEERNVRETLRESEEHFRQLIEAWPEQVMLRVNLTEGRHEYVSPSMERVLGYAPQEFYDDPGLGMRVVAPQWLDKASEWIAELKQGIVRPGYEFELVRKDGQHRWVHQVGVLRPRAPGQDVLVQFTFRDITEERAAREALRQSEERYRELAEGWLSQAVIRINLNTNRYEYVSPGMERLFGFAPEEFHQGERGIVGRTVAPEWRESVREWMAEARRGNLRTEYEFELIDAWGARRWVRQHCTLLHSADGTPEVVQGVLYDNTKRHLLEAELAASERKHRTLHESMRDGFAVVDMDGLFTEHNNAFRDMLGYSDEEIQRLTYRDITPERWHETEARILADQVFVRGYSNVYEKEYRRKDGTAFPVSVRTYMDNDAAGMPQRLWAVVRDITEQKRTEEALRKNEALLEAMLRNLPFDFWARDMHQRILMQSDESVRLWGDLTLPATRNSTRDEQTAEHWRTTNHRVLTGVAISEERTCQIKNGEEREFHSIVAPIRDGEEILGLVGVNMDITDRKRAEKALRESNARNRLIVETATEGIWTVDAEERATFVNAAMSAMMGYTAQEMLGRRTETFLYPEDIAPHRLRMEERRSGLDEVYERRFLRKDGTTLWVLASAKPLLDEAGGFDGAFAMFVDITERKRAEQALRESNARYSILAENVVDVIWTTDANLRWTYLSPSAERLSGVPLDQLIDLPFEKLFTPESMLIIGGLMARRKAAGPQMDIDEAYRAEMDIRHVDGTLVPLEVLVRPMRGPDGAISGYCGTSRDITERKQAEEALLASERRFSELIRYSSDSITILDKDGTQVFVSEAVERMLGFKATELMGIPVLEILVHPDDRERVRAAFALTLKEGMGGAQYRHKHKNGSWVYLEAWGTNQLENPDIRGVVINVRDITERRQAEAALRLSEARYALALKGANDGIWDWDLVQDQVYYSDRWKEIIGYGPDEIRHDADEWRSRIHPDDLDQVMAANQKCIQGEAPFFQVEYRLRHKDGSFRWIFGRGATLADATGRVVRMAGAHTDITARKQAEEALLKNERLSRKLLESMHEGIWAVDGNRRTTFVNERLCTMLGYASGELMNMSPMDVLEWPQRHVAKNQLSDLEAGFTGATDYVLIRKDGSRFPAHVVSSPVMEEQGRFEGLVCGVVDLTERARMEHELRRNQARFEALYELSRLTPATEHQLASFTLREAIRLTDSTAGVLFFVSQDAQQLVPQAWEASGYAPGQMPSFPTEGTQPWAMVAQNGLPLLINDFSQCAHLVPPGHPPVSRFLAVPALDGSRAAAVLGLTGKEEPYTAEDTLHVTLLLDGMWREVRTRRDEERIRASLSEKEALLHEVHHRVKNNLQVISSLMDMAGRRLASDEARMSLKELRGKVQAMSLIHAQLHGAGSGGGISLERFVRGLFQQLREVYAGGLDLSLQLQLGELALSLDQAVPLGLALNETLTNVFKHACPPGSDSALRASRVEIRAEQDMEGQVSIEIEDNGPGLPEGFDPDSAETLGIKLTRGLVRHQLRGKLTFRNTAPGVCVRIRFQPHIAT